MDWSAKVELFEEIRREYEFGVGTIAGVAKKLKVHRRMVREAIGSALPQPRKKTERPRWKIAAAAAFVDQILEADLKAPRKQRHTARRIWERIQSEIPGCRICTRTVRQYVRDRKLEMGQVAQETFVPQSYPWGVEAQVDWYEAYADLSGERTKLQVFSMRSMTSGAAFHCAFLHATQQAFLEAHEMAFAFFGGVFRRLRYDNLTSAVKKIVRGYRREETARFIAFRSHWRFNSEFCTPGEAHEKGGIEGEAGYFRRNHWVPVPTRHMIELLKLSRQFGRWTGAAEPDEFLRLVEDLLWALSLPNRHSRPIYRLQTRAFPFPPGSAFAGVHQWQAMPPDIPAAFSLRLWQSSEGHVPALSSRPKTSRLELEQSY